MREILGLAMFASQVWGAVILFGGHKDAPKWLKITIGILLLFSLLAMIGLATESGY